MIEGIIHDSWPSIKQREKLSSNHEGFHGRTNKAELELFQIGKNLTMYVYCIDVKKFIDT